MKPTLLKLATFLLMVAVAFTSCEKPVEPTKPNPPKPPQEPDPPPTGIPIELYSFGTHCFWHVRHHIGHFAEVFSIKSEEEMNNYPYPPYINCVEDGSYPEIDFSKHTLLLVAANAPYPISEMNKFSLHPWEDTEHLELTIEFTVLEKADYAYPWRLAFLTDKLCDTCRLLSLKPIYTYDYSDPKSLELKPGLYVETFPRPMAMKNTTINVIDHETLTINNGNEIKFVIDGYSIISSTNPYGNYFRIIDDNKFEMYLYHGVITDNIPPMMVFEKIEQ